MSTRYQIPHSMQRIPLVRQFSRKPDCLMQQALILWGTDFYQYLSVDGGGTFHVGCVTNFWNVLRSRMSSANLSSVRKKNYMAVYQNFVCPTLLMVGGVISRTVPGISNQTWCHLLLPRFLCCLWAKTNFATLWADSRCQKIGLKPDWGEIRTAWLASTKKTFQLENDIFRTPKAWQWAVESKNNRV